MLATIARLAAGWGVRPAQRVLLDRLGRRNAIDFRRATLDSASVAAKRGARTRGRTRTDRGKAGSKRHVLTYGNDIPLAIRLTGANVNDSTVLEEMVDAVPPIRQSRGPHRKRPIKLHADKAYDHSRCRRALTRRYIQPRIARRGIESSARLGRYSWVVERTLAWFGQFRRLAIRYDRRADIHLGFLTLASALIT